MNLDIKKMTKVHWNKFYKKFPLKKESSFAKFAIKKIKRKGSFLDIGCGNGRDTFYMIRKKKSLNCYGLDLSKTAIKNNKKIFKYRFIQKDICRKLNLKKKFDYIYCRFFLHTLNNKQEIRFFKNLKKISNKKSIFFFEFRTDLDPFLKKGKRLSKNESIFGHYRRFINIKEFKKNIKSFNFKLEYLKTSFNFARFKKERPHICRAILTNVSK